MYREDEFYEDEEDFPQPMATVKNLTNGKVYPAEIIYEDLDAGLCSVRIKIDGVNEANVLFKNVKGNTVAKHMGQDLQLNVKY